MSDRQRRDVVEVLRVNRGQLESAYLENWANRRGTTDLLQRAFADSAG